jgi:exodeoxyribonuclease V
MELTKKQQEGLDLAVQRYREGKPYTIISGYAGSGKSTLIKFIISALDVDPEKDVAYVAFTGKAATVLAKKGCPNATTAHKLLYTAVPKADGTYIFKPVPRGSLYYKVIVVDEISMLPAMMWYQLLSHGIYIIAAGDPFQLPPINPADDNHMLDNPHIFLDEIMRQAKDSEIIRLSMWIREGNDIKDFPCSNEEVKIMRKEELVSGVYTWADQILCATNATRTDINNKMRRWQGRNAEPEVGDKIVSLTNHWDDISMANHIPLTNGSIGFISGYDIVSQRVPKHITANPITYMYTDIELEDEVDYFTSVPIDYKCLMTGTSALTPHQCYQLRKSKKTDLEPPYDFAYAYALTYWKAQGSEWNKTLVIEENFPFDKLEHQRAMYSACTRASEKLVLARN